MELTIEIDKNQVIDSLARTTGYIGAKQSDSDAGAYGRIALNGGDRKLLDEFFDESTEVLSLVLRRHIISQVVMGDSYRLRLALSESFDLAMEEGLRSGIYGYLTLSMAAKWLSITDKDQASQYATAANTVLESVARKAYCKQKPKRPVFAERGNRC